MAKRSKKFNKIYISYWMYLIIGVALAVIFVLIKNDRISVAKGPSKPTAPASVNVSVLIPNGGEKFVQGQANTMSWKGGYQVVAVGLATSNADTNHAIDLPPANAPYTGPQQDGTTGRVIGFINTREGQGYYLPNSSTVWDGRKVCNYHPNLDPDTWCVDVAPGNYKIFVWSQTGGGSMYIGSGEGPTGKYTTKTTRGNWDLSDQTFTILAP